MFMILDLLAGIMGFDISLEAYDGDRECDGMSAALFIAENIAGRCGCGIDSMWFAGIVGVGMRI